MGTTQPIRNKDELMAFRMYYKDIRPNSRNYCLIVMGLNTALRISDLLRLKWDNVYNFKHHEFRTHFLINEQKTGKNNYVTLNCNATYEYFFKRYPNFLGWNFAEQFWGFNETDNPASANDVERIALFAKLVEMSHNYGGLLTISFCGNIWSHHLNPVGMLKRNADLMQASKDYPEAILWLYKYTTSSCFYNNESVCFGPFVAGLTKNYLSNLA